jgi:hypothetical protein
MRRKNKERKITIKPSLRDQRMMALMQSLHNLNSPLKRTDSWREKIPLKLIMRPLNKLRNI